MQDKGCNFLLQLFFIINEKKMSDVLFEIVQLLTLSFYTKYQFLLHCIIFCTKLYCTVSYSIISYSIKHCIVLYQVTVNHF